jgi:hypothetical protein
MLLWNAVNVVVSMSAISKIETPRGPKIVVTGGGINARQD